MSSVEKPRFSATPETVERAVQFLAPPGSSIDQVAAAMGVAAELEAAQNSFRFSFHPEMARPADPEVLGNKAARLAEIMRMGIPVPPLFTLTTDAWRLFTENENRLPEIVWEETLNQIRFLERKTGVRFGDENYPLVVSARSGAPRSLPGILATLVNIGLNDKAVSGLAKRTGEWCAWDSYRRAIESFAKNVWGVNLDQSFILESLYRKYGLDSWQKLPVEALKEAVQEYKEIVRETQGEDFPQDPLRQLRLSVETVLNSWNSPVAVQYRQRRGIPDEDGVAVTIQEMVFGNSQNSSGAGVYFSCNPHSGKKAQVAYEGGVPGSDIVTSEAIHHLASPRNLPRGFRDNLIAIGAKLERHFGWPQEIEFVVERGKLWVLQTRDAQLSPKAVLAVLRNYVTKDGLPMEEAIRRLSIPQIEALLTPSLDPQEVEKAKKAGGIRGQGIPLSPGIAQGKVAKTLEEAQRLGFPVILVLESLTNEKLTSLPDSVRGITLRLGGAGSHIAQLLRNARGGQGIPTLSGLDSNLFNQDEEITLEATQGLVLVGKIPPAREPPLAKNSLAFLRRGQELLHRNPWLAACYPVENKYRWTTLGLAAEVAFAESQESWQSPKARDIALINAVIPPEIRMQYWVFKPNATAEIQTTFEEILAREGQEASLRSCHNPPKLALAPWQLISKPGEINLFLSQPNFPGEYGGYPRWLEDETLTEVVIGQFPQGKLDPRLAKEHCVFTFSCQGDRVLIQIYPRSAQLRDLEQADPRNLITVTANIDLEGKGGLGQITTQFGGKLESDSQAQEFAKIVTEKVLKTWWQPPWVLPHRLAALTALAQLTSLDGQARLYPDGARWCLIYDMKGKRG